MQCSVVGRGGVRIRLARSVSNRQISRLDNYDSEREGGSDEKSHFRWLQGKAWGREATTPRKVVVPTCNLESHGLLLLVVLLVLRGLVFLLERCWAEGRLVLD
jgi:hypothetical protein